MNLYQNILNSKKDNIKLLAILLDPDKLDLKGISQFITKINQSPATHLLVGGSSFQGHHLDDIISVLKKATNLPVVLFYYEFLYLSHLMN